MMMNMKWRINFRCKIAFGERLSFENEIKCEDCGVLTLDEVESTELGQTQVSELLFKECP
jgi:hypothetical protein